MNAASKSLQSSRWLVQGPEGEGGERGGLEGINTLIQAHPVKGENRTKGARQRYSIPI